MLEPAEIARWERLTDSMLGHAATDDPEAFAQVLAVLDRAYDKLPAVVEALRNSSAGPAGRCGAGYSWADLGQALGVTRDAAAKRFRRR